MPRTTKDSEKDELNKKKSTTKKNASAKLSKIVNMIFVSNK